METCAARSPPSPTSVRFHLSALAAPSARLRSGILVQDSQMDPIPPILTEHFPRNEADTPRTHDLKLLRAKRVAYYESIGIIKGDTSRKDSQPLLVASQGSKVNTSENPTFEVSSIQISPHYLAIGKKPLLQEETKVAPGESEQVQDQRPQEEPRKGDCLTKLDLHLLADALVPERQKLRHVISWAQKFLSSPLEEYSLKCPPDSPGFPQSNLCQYSKAQESKKNVHPKSLYFPPLLKEDQCSPQTDIPSFFLSPPNNFLEVDFSSEFSGSFLKQEFPRNNSYEWQETPVMSEGEGSTSRSLPDCFQKEDSTQGKYERSRNSCIQNPDDDKMFPERLKVLPQLIQTSEVSETLEEARQSPLRNGYFWTPLTDSSEEEGLDEPEENKGTLRRFSGITFSPTNHSTLVSKTMVSLGETCLDTESREWCREVAESSVGTSKEVIVELKADSSRDEELIQRLPERQCVTSSYNADGRRDSDSMGLTLRSRHTEIKHKSDWKHVLMEQAGEVFLGAIPGGAQNRSVHGSATSNLPLMTQKQFDLTLPESFLGSQIVSQPLEVSEGPLDNAVFPVCSDSTIFCGPTVDADGAWGSTWYDQLPLPEKDEQPTQTSQVVPGETTHKKTEKTLPSNHSIFRNISTTHLKGSFPPQDVGHSLSCSEEPLSKPEQGASVLETYFYYVHMLNKIRGLSSEDRNSSLPFQGSRTSKSSLVIPFPGSQGSSKSSLDRKTKGWREGEGPTQPREQACVEEATPEAAVWEEARFWKPEGNYGSVEKFFSKNEFQDEERENKEQKRDADFSQWLLLPDEIWICIFSLLSHKELARVAQVCHHFYWLANDESLWKQVQIADCCALEDEWLVALARHQPRSLTLQRCRHVGQAVTHRGLKRLFQHCQDVLQELNVISCSGPGLMGDEILLHAGALCSQLSAVDLSWSGATDVGVLALIQGASSLRGLSINGCQITDKAITALVRKHGNSLHKIEVFGCFGLTARSIDSLALRCPHLRTLNIGRVPKVSEACLVRILKNLPEMTALNVAALKLVKDGIVHLIVTHCPKLESLVLSSCSQVTDVSLVEISTYLKTLRYLDVSGCRQVTNAGIHALARSCHQLKCLDLSSTGINKRGLLVDKINFSKNIPRNSRKDLQHSKDKSFNCLSYNPSLHGIQHLLIILLSLSSLSSSPTCQEEGKFIPTLGKWQSFHVLYSFVSTRFCQEFVYWLITVILIWNV
ncbi:PREDICTED: uncharacterized protein LOC105853282 [Condylura cristata]|uniref:uncharacterized protein LOC105853282 n=1 Tax=Condylura cristata TaxID=143302 RepID=UPI000643C6BE|nr:PREDICTED: uncharacterized protein LOC105853282 [Condylura cristata]